MTLEERRDVGDDGYWKASMPEIKTSDCTLESLRAIVETANGIEIVPQLCYDPWNLHGGLWTGLCR